MNKPHDHSPAHNHNAESGIKIAFFLNLAFVVIEIVGGIFTNSVAILSDAVHDLGDCVAIACAWFLERFSKKSPDEKFTMGYRRFSLLSAVITGLVLLLGSVVVVYASVRRLMSPAEVRGAAMFAIAVFGVVINGLAVLKTARSVSKNEKAISLHLLEDVLGWVAVLLGSLFVWLFHLNIIDPILSICVGIYVLVRAIMILADALPVFLERSPGHFDRQACLDAVLNLTGVAGAHSFCTWSTDGTDVLADIHVEVEPDADAETLFSLKMQIVKTLEDFGVMRATVQLDLPGTPCSLKNPTA